MLLVTFLWNTGGASIVYNTPQTPTPTEITYSIVQDSYPGAGNITVPYVTGDELTLDAGFPGIDAGNGDMAPEFDRDGHPRVDVESTSNIGTGTPDYTDIGAYEYQP